MYMTIGNIKSNVQNQVSLHAWVPIAYLPIIKFSDNSDLNGLCVAQFYHQCMAIVMKTLLPVEANGVVTAAATTATVSPELVFTWLLGFSLMRNSTLFASKSLWVHLSTQAYTRVDTQSIFRSQVRSDHSFQLLVMFTRCSMSFGIEGNLYEILMCPVTFLQCCWSGLGFILHISSLALRTFLHSYYS